MRASGRNQVSCRICPQSQDLNCQVRVHAPWVGFHVAPGVAGSHRPESVEAARGSSAHRACRWHRSGLGSGARTHRARRRAGHPWRSCIQGPNRSSAQDSHSSCLRSRSEPCSSAMTVPPCPYKLCTWSKVASHGARKGHGTRCSELRAQGMPVLGSERSHLDACAYLPVVDTVTCISELHLYASILSQGMGGHTGTRAAALLTAREHLPNPRSSPPAVESTGARRGIRLIYRVLGSSFGGVELGQFWGCRAGGSIGLYKPCQHLPAAELGMLRPGKGSRRRSTTGRRPCALRGLEACSLWPCGRHSFLSAAHAPPPKPTAIEYLRDYRPR